MKKHILVLAIFGFLLIYSINVNAQTVGISSSSITPDPSSMLEIRATNQGILIPRVSSFPSSPAEGLLIYSTAGYGTNGEGFYYYDGSDWNILFGGTSTGDYIKNQNLLDQTANFRITGDGRFGGNISVNGGVIKGPGINGGSADGILYLQSDGDIRVQLDVSNNGANEFHIFKNAATSLFKITEAGDMSLYGGSVTFTALNSAGVVHNTAGGLLSTGLVAMGSEVSGTLAVGNGGTGATTLTGMLKGNGSSPITAQTSTGNFAAYWSDANTLTGEQYLNVTRGGLGANMTAGAVGAIPYSTSTTAYGTLADVSVGSYLRSGGAGVAPLWSTVKIPNAATIGDIWYGSAANTISALADVATGNALISGGIGVAPSWGKIGLTTHVSGTLAVGNGGTGATTLTGYVYGNGAGAMSASTTIPNSALSNSTITITPSGVGLSVSGSPVALGGTVTITSNATSANTASTLVSRNASGNFSAGQINANLLGLIKMTDNRAIAPSSIASGSLQFGFTSYNNNNSSPYGDFLHLRSYTDASGGNDNLIVFRKDVIGMRIYQQTFGNATAYSTYKDVAFAQDVATGYIQNITPAENAGQTANIYLNGQIMANENGQSPDRWIKMYSSAAQVIETSNDLYIGTTGASAIHLQPGRIGSSNSSVHIRNNAGINWASFDGVNERLGIGTAVPGYKLDVSGDIRSTGKIWANANGASYFRGGDDAELWDVNVANTIGIYGLQNQALATIRLGNGTADISGSGANIGIGTTSPSFKLHVPSGYIGTDYINTTDNSVGSGVTGIMVKAGDNYHRTASAAAIATFLGNYGNWIPNDGSGDWQIASNSNATSYSQASLELRETNFSGAGQQPPRLGFHWGGVVASQIGMESSGRIAILNNPGTGYENLVANNMYTAGNAYIGAYGGINSIPTSYGSIGLLQAYNGYYGVLFGQSTSNPNLMYDGSGNGGIYYQNWGWLYYTTASNHFTGLGTTGPGYPLHIVGNTSSNKASASFYPATTGVGSNYSYNTTYGGSLGYSYASLRGSSTNAYQFGLVGQKDENYDGAYYWDLRSGGVLGTLWYSGSGNYLMGWGSLGYFNSGSTTYGGYFTSYTSGGGFMDNDGNVKGIGSGSYGGVMGGWSRGEVLGFTTAGELYASYNLGNEYTSGVSAEIVTTATERVPVYSVTSNEVKVYADGYAQLNNGTYHVNFDEAFIKVISSEGKPTVTITPIGACQGIYITEIGKNGFTVKEQNGGTSNVEFSWIAIGKRVDAENVTQLPEALKDRNFDNNMKGVMFNENNKEQSATPIWWDGTKLRFDAPPKQNTGKKEEAPKSDNNNNNVNDPTKLWQEQQEKMKQEKPDPNAPVKGEWDNPSRLQNNIKVVSTDQLPGRLTPLENNNTPTNLKKEKQIDVNKNKTP